jgi:hypothetical protein
MKDWKFSMMIKGRIIYVHYDGEKINKITRSKFLFDKSQGVKLPPLKTSRAVIDITGTLTPSELEKVDLALKKQIAKDLKFTKYIGAYLNPHRVLTALCKGILVEPIDQYGEWAYWRGPNSGGFYSTPC